MQLYISKTVKSQGQKQKKREMRLRKLLNRQLSFHHMTPSAHLCISL